MYKFLISIIVITTTFYLGLNSFYFGKQDYVSLAFIVINTFIIYQVMIVVQLANKRTLRIYAKKGSWFYNFLSYEKSLFTSILSFFLSFFMSVSMILILKGIERELGLFQLIISLLIVSLFIFVVINYNTFKSKTINENLHQDISNHINTIATIVFVSIMLDLLITALYSYYDTKIFLDSNVDFNNIVDLAYENKIDKMEYNEISRRFINISILIDYIKGALANTILLFFKINKNNFLMFYIIIFIINFLKFLPFSFALVFLQKGFESIVRWILFVLVKIKIITPEIYKKLYKEEVINEAN